MNNGWIKLYRKIADNPMYFSEPFTRMQAWIDMLILANHNDKYFYVRGNKIDIKRGQIGLSKENLAKRWKWSRGKVLRFLKQLEIDHQIVQQNNSVISLISIVNYNLYQSDGTTDSTTDGTTDGQQTVQQTDNRRYRNKNDKNDKNDKNIKKVSTNVDTKESEPKTDFEKFNVWLSKKAPYCANPKNFEKQITEGGFYKLKEKYNGEQIAFVISQIENRRDLRKKYTDLYRTVLNWAKREYGS